MLSKMSDYFDGHFMNRKYSYLGKKISYFWVISLSDNSSYHFVVIT